MGNRRRARPITFLVSLALATVGLAFTAGVASAHSNGCGNGAHLWVYDAYNLQSFLGQDCLDDTNWHNGLGLGGTNVGDKASSLALRGTVGQTWCVRFYQSVFDSTTILATYRVHNGADVHINQLPPVANNQISWHRQTQIDFNGSC